jgi:hypothetical protein
MVHVQTLVLKLIEWVMVHTSPEFLQIFVSPTVSRMREVVSVAIASRILEQRLTEILHILSKVPMSQAACSGLTFNLSWPMSGAFHGGRIWLLL